jgi:hypothetical protein
MFYFFSLLFFMLFSSTGIAIAEEPNDVPIWELPELEPAIIYVAISEVTMSTGKGTSEELNVLVEHYGSQVGNLEYQLAKKSRQQKRRVDVYNRENIRFFHPGCDYIADPLGCGVKNGHWTLRTFVQVGDKYSTVIVRLYDEKGQIIGQGKKTAWGTIRLLPQWKLTTIKESGGFMGDKTTEIFEQYPPKIEELPPLITPYHIHQATLGMFLSVKLKD